MIPSPSNKKQESEQHLPGQIVLLGHSERDEQVEGAIEISTTASEHSSTSAAATYSSSIETIEQRQQRNNSHSSIAVSPPTLPLSPPPPEYREEGKESQQQQSVYELSEDGIDEFIFNCDDYHENGPRILLSSMARRIDGSSSVSRNNNNQNLPIETIRGRRFVGLVSLDARPGQPKYMVWNIIFSNGNMMEWSHRANQIPPGGFHRYDGTLEDLEKQTGEVMRETHAERFITREIKDGCCSYKLILAICLTLAFLLGLSIALNVFFALDGKSKSKK